MPKAGRYPGGGHWAVALAEAGPGKPLTQRLSLPAVGAATLSVSWSARRKAGGGQCARGACARPVPSSQSRAQRGAPAVPARDRTPPLTLKKLRRKCTTLSMVAREPGSRSPPAGPRAALQCQRSRNASPGPAPALAPGRPTSPASLAWPLRAPAGLPGRAQAPAPPAPGLGPPRSRDSEPSAGMLPGGPREQPHHPPCGVPARTGSLRVLSRSEGASERAGAGHLCTYKRTVAPSPGVCPPYPHQETLSLPPLRGRGASLPGSFAFQSLRAYRAFAQCSRLPHEETGSQRGSATCVSSRIWQVVRVDESS